MFSRAAFCSGALKAALTKPGQHRLALLTAVRSSSTDDVPIREHTENWERAHAKFFGPERDLKNYPLLTQPERSPPVRMGWVPIPIMDNFYEKTGVTGPYLFGAGFITFVMSKEYWVMDHQATEFVYFLIFLFIIQKKIAPKITAFIDKFPDEYLASRWAEPLEETKVATQINIDSLEAEVKSQDSLKYIFESKKENVDLQLEANYRQRLVNVHAAVKKRLDYHMDLELAQKRLEQNHMVNWIVKGVESSITPQQEKDSIRQCIKDLKTLSARI